MTKDNIYALSSNRSEVETKTTFVIVTEFEFRIISWLFLEYKYF